MSTSIAIRVTEANNVAPLVAILRDSTQLSAAEIAAAIKACKPVRICDLFDRDHNEAEANIRKVLESLDRTGVSFEVIVDGRVESREYLFNRLEAYHQTAFEMRLEIELELGEPSPEAERWGRGEFVRRNERG